MTAARGTRSLWPLSLLAPNEGAVRQCMGHTQNSASSCFPKEKEKLWPSPQAQGKDFSARLTSLSSQVCSSQYPPVGPKHVDFELRELNRSIFYLSCLAFHWLLLFVSSRRGRNPLYHRQRNGAHTYRRSSTVVTHYAITVQSCPDSRNMKPTRYRTHVINSC